MQDTVKKGTARGIKTLMRKKLRKNLLIGAKTGSITVVSQMGSVNGLPLSLFQKMIKVEEYL